jgi:hypothetical protein
VEAERALLTTARQQLALMWLSAPPVPPSGGTNYVRPCEELPAINWDTSRPWTRE